MIAIITALVFIIRIAEIFIDPLLGNLVDNTTSRWGRFKPWQVIGGVGSSILLFAIFTGLFGLVNVNKGVFIVVFIIVFRGARRPLLAARHLLLGHDSRPVLLLGGAKRLHRLGHLHRFDRLQRRHRDRRSCGWILRCSCGSWF